MRTSTLAGGGSRGVSFDVHLDAVTKLLPEGGRRGSSHYSSHHPSACRGGPPSTRERWSDYARARRRSARGHRPRDNMSGTARTTAPRGASSVSSSLESRARLAAIRFARRAFGGTWRFASASATCSTCHVRPRRRALTSRATRSPPQCLRPWWHALTAFSRRSVLSVTRTRDGARDPAAARCACRRSMSATPSRSSSSPPAPSAAPPPPPYQC